MASIRAPCSIPYCQHPKSTHSGFCSTHASRLARNGHVEQNAITSSQILPFVCHVVEAITSRPDAQDIWRALEQRWAAYLASAEAIVERGTYVDPETMGISSTRRATPNEVVAAKAILKTATFGVRPKPRTVIANVLAVILMREVSPEFFQDDRAFIFQVGRRFLGLNSANAVVVGKAGSTYYRALKAPAMEILGTFLLQALGEAGRSLVTSIQHKIAAVQINARVYRQAAARLQSA
jgi:hypothetical protein